jgi:D-arabinose 1-dehydrogenase-like Zn-dependent alcohol dehydrogenase
VLVDPEFVIPLPAGASFEQAAAATDAGMTSYHAIVTRGKVTKGMRVGIIGLGGLGSLGAQIALAAGASVYVAEINPVVHDYARDIGVEHVSDSIATFADDELDVIVDFAGFEDTTGLAVETVRRRGRVVRVGLARDIGQINLNLLTLNSIDLVGSQAGTKEDCAAVLDLVAAGDLSSRVTKIAFDQIGEGMEQLERGGVVGRLVAVY